jgi:hypothetical protein
LQARELLPEVSHCRDGANVPGKANAWALPTLRGRRALRGWRCRACRRPSPAPR